MKGLLLIFAIMVFGCSGIDSGLSKPNIMVREYDMPCFLDVSEEIDSSEGCPGFLLHKNLKENHNNILVIKANRLLFKKDTCYEMDVNQLMYDSLMFNVYIDIYSSNSIRKTYCGDINIVNAERPQKAHCTSGTIKCMIKSTGDVTKEVITLELTDAIFKYSHKKVVISKCIFENVLISEWGG